MSRPMKVGADGKIPYLPPLGLLGAAACSGLAMGTTTSLLYDQYYAKARSALLKKKTLSSALVYGSRMAVFCPLYFTMEQSLTAARGKSGPLNCFLAGTVASALTCPARSPLRRCVSSLFMGSASAIGKLT